MKWGGRSGRSRRSARRAAAQESFEAFYKDVRGRLLLQCYALTGDLQASQKAVRDALIVTWHHWRKVCRLEHPEDYARPLSWTRAQRRSSARWFARQKDISPEAKLTLDALAKLSTRQRKVLLLTQLTSLPLDDISRELGLTRPVVEHELQAATSRFAAHRDRASTDIRDLLLDLDEEVETARWPRPSILMRAGAARRRSHTTVGAAAALAALVVSGALVTDAAGVRPRLESKGITAGERPAVTREPPPPDPLTAAALLTTEQVTAAYPGDWTEGRTTRNTEGDGLVFTCQAGRYADQAGLDALVRTFTAERKRGSLTAGQSAEASADEEAAAQTYQTTLGWYAGCMAPRQQLLGTYEVRGAGEEAKLLVLRGWNDPLTTEVVGVARTGTLTTTTVHAETTTDAPDLRSGTRLLAQAVDNLCGLPGGGECASRARATASAPVPVGAEPSMLSEVDLPPVSGVSRPWVGTDPVKATTNVAATRCDDASFSGGGFSRNMTRSFVIPTATQLPAEFGLTQTVGALPERAAAKFVAGIRQKLEVCPDEDFGTDVTRIADESKGRRALTAWRLTVSISDERSVRFLMAIIRNGTAVSQISFVPAGDVSMASDAFVELARRAQARLAELGPPSRG